MTDQQIEQHKVVYKRVKMLMPHCNVCGEQLRGENSGILPYRCSCGVWKSHYNFMTYEQTFTVERTS